MSRSSSSSGISFAPERRAILIAAILGWVGQLPAAANHISDVADPMPLPPRIDWRTLYQTLFPHPDIDASFYDATVAALLSAADRSAEVRSILSRGWRELERYTRTSWDKADPGSRIAAVTAMVGSPFFVLIRQTAVFNFYNDERVWTLFGYDGDAWRFGGWSGKTEFSALDWLPDPPVKRDW